MARHLVKAIKARMGEATKTWDLLGRGIIRNKAISPRLKILLWNSLIRGTVIYGLHTKELTQTNLVSMDG